MTVNITCHICDGRRLCDACRSAARTFVAAGYRVEHSTRYAALRAAASGRYGFDACVVPVDAHERAIVDAAVALLPGKRVAVVVGAGNGFGAGLPANVAVLQRDRYAAGDFSVSWLGSGESASTVPASDETATIVVPAERIGVADGDRARATRRLKRIADQSREEIARADLAIPPPLEMLAVIEDEIAWARVSGCGFTLLLVHMPGVSAGKPGGGGGGSGDDRLRAAGDVIRRCVRTVDVIAGRGDDFVIVLGEATDAGARSVVARISAAVGSSSLRGVVKPKRSRRVAAWGIGRATYPDDGGSREALLARATATLEPIV